MGYIDYDVKIDFPLPKVLKNTMEEAEELDRVSDDEYFCVADTIDVLAKEAYACRKITREQWDIILKRYHM